MTATLPSSDTKRIRWRCRRGMKELDILLVRFLEAEYESLDETDRVTFQCLLEESDMELYAWMTGRSYPDDAAYARLVDRIRAVNPAG